VAPSTTGSRAGAYRRYADVYDLVWRAAPYDQFADLCLGAATRAAVRPERIVDAACGTCNLVMEFASRGYRAVGFDLSDSMLERAVAKRRATRLDFDVALGDLRAAPLADGSADLALSLNASLNYLLETDEVVAALSHLRRITAPDGVVVVEPLAARFIHQGYDPGRHVRDGGFQMDATHELHGDLLVERLEWTVDGIEGAESYCQRYYDDEQFEAMIGAAGLVVVERLPMYPFIEAEPARGRMLWVALP
jgi:SAM-dependent methyltransferase